MNSCRFSQFVTNAAKQPELLTVKQLAILCYIYIDNLDVTITACTEKLNSSTANISIAVSKLEYMGLIKRRKDFNDRRKSTLSRTPKGFNYVNNIIKNK